MNNSRVPFSKTQEQNQETLKGIVTQIENLEDKGCAIPFVGGNHVHHRSTVAVTLNMELFDLSTWKLNKVICKRDYSGTSGASDVLTEFCPSMRLVKVEPKPSSIHLFDEFCFLKLRRACFNASGTFLHHQLIQILSAGPAMQFDALIHLILGDTLGSQTLGSSWRQEEGHLGTSETIELTHKWRCWLDWLHGFSYPAGQIQNLHQASPHELFLDY